MTIEQHLAFMGSSVLIDHLAMRLADLPKAAPAAKELEKSMAAASMLQLAVEEPRSLQR